MPKNALEKLAFDYFKLFAQLESVMKSRGMTRAAGATNKRGHRNIEIAWNELAKLLGKDFPERIDQQSEAAKYIFKYPPLKQVFLTDRVQWVRSKQSKDTTLALLLYLGRLRNNLFHGAKFDGTFSDGWAAPARSETLLGHGVTILQAIKHELK